MILATLLASFLVADTVSTVPAAVGIADDSQNALVAAAAEEEPTFTPPSYVDESAVVDMRVKPFLKVKWGQGNVGGAPCYNSKTPHNLKAGCAAVAMGQVIRYWQHPVGDLVPFSNMCERTTYIWDTSDMERRPSSQSEEGYLESSGIETGVRSYDFSLMPEEPASVALTDEERDAIGTLLADCAISLASKFQGNFNADLSENLGSVHQGVTNSHVILPDSYPEYTTAEPEMMAKILRTHFGFASASIYNESARKAQAKEIWESENALGSMINSNLDARKPVIIVFCETDVRDLKHYAVADGYGFLKGDDGKLYEYVHLNLGWEGKGDGWYRLPILDTSASADLGICGAGKVFESIKAVIYDISPVATGPIASGYVAKSIDEETVEALQGADIRLYANGDIVTPKGVKDSDEYGVFAFETDFETSTNILIEAHYNDSELGPLAAEKWLPLPTSTLLEDDYSLTSTNNAGNLWDGNVILKEANAIVDGVGYLSLERAFTAAETSPTPVPVIEIVREIDFGSIDWEIERDIIIRSTNDVPSQALISRSGSGVIKIKEGVNVLFTNVYFQALGTNFPVVEVEEGATCQISGDVQLDTIKLLGSGKIKATSPLNPNQYYTVDTTLSTNEVFGAISGDETKFDESGSLFIHASDEGLGGQVLDDGSLSWVDRDPPESATVLKLVQDGQTNNFRSFDKLFKSVTNDCEILVVQDCNFTNKYTLAHRMIISSYNDSRVVSSPVALGADESITIVEGGELVLTNISFTGHIGGEFIKLAGGNLVLEDGAKLFDIENNKTRFGGAVYAERGKLVVSKGAEVYNIRATATASMGGFACISPTAEIELAGGTIKECFAKANGGAIYAAYQNAQTMARVAVTGPAVVTNNIAQSQSAIVQNGNDVFIGSAQNLIVLAGDATGGRIGVQYASSAIYPRNSESNVFAVVEASTLDADKLASSAKVFFSNSDDTLTGAVSDDETELIWYVEPAVQHLPLEGDEISKACAMVIFNDSNQTQYWQQVDWALNSLTKDATIELLSGHAMTEKVVITNNVSIYSLDPSLVITNASTASYFDYTLGSFVYHRTLEVLPGATLTISNFTMTAKNAPGPLFDVRGAFVIDSAHIKNVASSSSADDTVVWVAFGGEFTMLNGASIEGCSSTATDTSLRVGSAVRSLGGKVILNGCSVKNCTGVAGGALYFGSGTIVEIGGETTVVSNTLQSGESANIVIAATRLTLVSELKDIVGVMPIYSSGGSTNIFASVSQTYDGDLDSLTNSASMFVNDITGDVGVVVTNVLGEAFIAWASAIDRENLALEVDHEEYYLVGQLPEPPLPVVPLAEPLPIGFTSIELRDDGTCVLRLTNAVMRCRYYLYTTNSLVGGFVIPDDGSGAKINFVSDVDGEFGFEVPVAQENQFFKVLALPEAPIK